MRINKSFKIALLTAGLLALTACASDKVGGGANGGANGNADANGANANGVGQMSSFGGTGNAMKVGNQSYFFEFNSSDVNGSDQPSIKVQANYLVAHPNAKVRLEGNTDDRGSREYNVALGNRRALAVASALEMDGVSKSQIVTVSYGAEKPVALGSSEDAWSKNRRVDLVYTAGLN